MKNLLATAFITLLGFAASSTIAATTAATGIANEQQVTLDTGTGTLYGSLLMPAESESETKPTVALIIAGSGATDRNGNNPQMTNNSLKMLAEQLSKHNIASLRFDKRGIAKSHAAMKSEADLRFDDYINDAKTWVDWLAGEQGFDDIVVIGHSEGSLIGMVAAQQSNVAKFVSLAGAGRPIDEVLTEQLAAQPAPIPEQSAPIIEQLKLGKTVDAVPPMLVSVFTPSVQPYIISWMKYDPAREIGKLQKPVLIVQGTTDIQITMEDANRLSQGNPKATKSVIDGMNHVFKEAPMDRMANIQTYMQPDLPLVPELVDSVTQFINAQ